MTSVLDDAAAPAATRGPIGAAVSWLARSLRCTEGQAYTVAIGVLVGLFVAAVGIPPTLKRVTIEHAAVPAPSVAPPPAAPSFAPTRPAGDQGWRPVPPAAPDPAKDATTGTVTPVAPPPARAAGVFTDLPGPARAVAITADRDGLIVLTGRSVHDRDDQPATLVVVGPNGSVLDQVALPSDIQIVGGVDTRAGRTVVTAVSPARVLAVDTDAWSVTTLAEVPDIPPCLPSALLETRCQPGPIDQPPRPQGVAIDAMGNALVADSGQGIIWSVSADGTTRIWFSDVALVGSQLDTGVTGIALDGRGDAVVSVPASLLDLGAGSVAIITEEAGTGQRITRLATVGTEELPAGVAIGPDADVAVALSGTDEVLVLDPGGAERHRLTLTPPVGTTPLDLTATATQLLVTVRADRAARVAAFDL